MNNGLNNFWRDTLADVLLEGEGQDLQESLQRVQDQAQALAPLQGISRTLQGLCGDLLERWQVIYTCIQTRVFELSLRYCSTIIGMLCQTAIAAAMASLAGKPPLRICKGAFAFPRSSNDQLEHLWPFSASTEAYACGLDGLCTTAARASSGHAIIWTG